MKATEQSHQKSDTLKVLRHTATVQAMFLAFWRYAMESLYTR